MRCFSKVGDHVVAITPVYNIFFHSIENNGRKTLMVPLLKNEEGYALDFKKIEEAFALPSTSLCLFCNPQNPIGIIWKKEDLARLARSWLSQHFSHHDHRLSGQTFDSMPSHPPSVHHR